MSDKALKACAQYARLSSEIKRLTSQIAESLDLCKGVNGKRRGTETIDGETFPTYDDTEPTHLKDAYTPETVEVGYMELGERWLKDSEIREQLACCPACLAAHEAIQARKAARKQFGIVKRRIQAYGRAALESGLLHGFGEAP